MDFFSPQLRLNLHSMDPPQTLQVTCIIWLAKIHLWVNHKCDCICKPATQTLEQTQLSFLITRTEKSVRNHQKYSSTSPECLKQKYYPFSIPFSLKERRKLPLSQMKNEFELFYSVFHRHLWDQIHPLCESSLVQFSRDQEKVFFDPTWTWSDGFLYVQKYFKSLKTELNQSAHCESF